MLVRRESKPVLKPYTRKHAALVPGMLPIQVKFGRPPIHRPVFELCPLTPKRVDAFRLPQNCIRANFQIALSLHVVIVGNEVRPLLVLSEGKWGEESQGCDA